MTRTVAVVPLRGGRGSKTRLASLLGPDDRAALVATLARHVVSTVSAAPDVCEVLVVVPAGDAATAAPTGAPGAVRVLTQPADRPGLNAAVELGRGVAAAGGSDGDVRLLVLHGDLPALTVDDVGVLVAAHGPLTLAADRAGTGTNALVLDPAAAPFGFRFGRESLAAHRAQARRLGWHPTVVHRPGTGVDLDTADDWAALPDHVRDRLRHDVPGLAALDARR